MECYIRTPCHRLEILEEAATVWYLCCRRNDEDEKYVNERRLTRPHIILIDFFNENQYALINHIVVENQPHNLT